MPTIPYERKAHYHETDQMGMVYHANYIHWFEEASVDMMNQLGISYKALAEAGIVIPVLEVHADYKSVVRFDDTAVVYVNLVHFDGVRMEVQCRVADKATGKTCCTGYTKHCFLTKEGRPVSLKRTNPDFYGILNVGIGLNKEYFAG